MVIQPRSRPAPQWPITLDYDLPDNSNLIILLELDPCLPHLLLKMSIIDSRYGIYIEDPKPVKVCQWGDCLDAESGYGDRKMCARCNVVRYCSKACQRADWGEQKRYCRIPPIMDIGEWIDKHESLLRWALIEELRLRSDPSNILGYGPCVYITHMDRLVKGISTSEIARMDRLVKGIAPSPFLESTSILSFADINELTQSDVCPLSGSRKIIAAGGIGTGVMIFNIVPRGPGGYTFWRVQKYDIREMPLGEENPTRTKWEEVVNGVVNGEIPVASLSRMAEASV
ncbi:hypothetical protein C8R44DRAFT_865814 [Mycena epipterygia]|nr:hypothetical protein C8R44DRAFT_865814 [Mycena epipterygia]